MKRYSIIGDSCMDLSEEMKQDPHFSLVPLTLSVGNTIVMDDETFRQKDFLKLVKESPEIPRSACPSPAQFMEAVRKADAEMVFIVTISEHLSGSYQSACLGASLFMEECGQENTNVHVFSSDSASVGETLIAKRIQELAESGASFEEIVSGTEHFLKKKLKTFFVLDDMEALHKNGRLGDLTALLATKLDIRPVMAGEHGKIVKLAQTRGLTRAYRKMTEELVAQIGEETKERILAIAHCNAAERALQLRRILMNAAEFRDIFIVDTGGVSSLYACDGGVIVCC